MQLTKMLIQPADSDETVQQGCCSPMQPLRLDNAAAEELATVFKAIANPVRLQILDILSRQDGQVCVCDIEGYFELSQPTISHHLRVMRQAGLVESEQRGTWIYYFVRPQKMEMLRSFLGGFCC
ncbi:MAG: helix-turn-helix transcriptional regulator [Caldilineaceae bacterium]|nr:helix-turn-helix transcriptional regulator [Caldilineaceae bacterium]